jgi:CBS domain-containing protein
MLISDVLRGKASPMVSLSANAPVSALLALMKARGVGAVLILDHRDRYLGSVSERDIVVGLADAGTSFLGRTARQIMTADGPSTTSPSRAVEAMQTMTERRVRHLPVIDHDMVVGIVSLGDIIRSQLAEKIEENTVLQALARAHLAAA